MPYQPPRFKCPMIASSRLQTLLITGYIIVSALTRPRHYNVRQFIAKAENIINELLERRTRLSSKSALKITPDWLHSIYSIESVRGIHMRSIRGDCIPAVVESSGLRQCAEGQEWRVAS